MRGPISSVPTNGVREEAWGRGGTHLSESGCMEEGLNLYCEDQWKPWGGRFQFNIMKDFLTIKLKNEMGTFKDSSPSLEFRQR